MEQTVTNGNGITEGVIWKQLLLFFFPILLGTFFQQLYNTVDAIIVGKYVGTEALAAVGGGTATLINLLVGFFVGLSSGATVIISQLYGAKQVDETSRAVHTAIAMGIAGGLVFMVVGILFFPTFLAMMGTPPEVLKHAVVYMRIYFGGMVFSLLYNMGSSILRAVGDPKRPLYFLIVSCFVNLVLDYVFIVWMGMGVAGAALATVISQVISAILVLISLVKTDLFYRLELRKIHLHMDMFRRITKIGLPAGLQSVMYSASNIVIQSTINTFGTGTIAAWTAYGKIDGIFWMMMSAFGVSITTFSGQNFGAGRYDRIRKSVRICLVMATSAAVLLSVILYFFGPIVYRLFTDDANVVAIGMEIIKIMVPFYFTYVGVEVLAGAARGTGDAFFPMLITCLGICVLRVSWIWFVVPMNPTFPVVMASYPVTWATTSVLFILYYLQGGWMRRSIARVGLPPENPHPIRDNSL